MIAEQVLIDTQGTEKYIGRAGSGAKTSDAVFQICKLTLDADGNITSILYANGLDDYNNAWDDRADLEYK